MAAGAPPTTNLSFGNVPIFQEVVDGTAVPVQTAFSGAAISLAPPTAATAIVAGRVFGGQNGLPNARVTLTDSTGNARTAGTNSFGYFTFTGLAVGQTYLIRASAKRYEFNPQVINVNEDVLGLEFRSKTRRQCFLTAGQALEFSHFGIKALVGRSSSYMTL